jgi:hypothetical protein
LLSNFTVAPEDSFLTSVLIPDVLLSKKSDGTPVFAPLFFKMPVKRNMHILLSIQLIVSTIYFYLFYWYLLNAPLIKSLYSRGPLDSDRR